MGKEFRRLFADRPVNKILTLEASGIGIACIAAQYFNVPVVFAKKAKSINLDGEMYMTKIQSFTHQRVYDVIVSKKFLTPDDHILIIDDFLANGCAVNGLIDLINSAGAVIEKIGRRRGVLEHMTGLDRVRMEFLVPSRGLFGYRSEFMTDTRGEGIMSSVFEKYEPVKGDIPHRNVGALICHENGTTTSYGLFNTQERGTLFIGVQTPVYKGMICGQNARPDDLVVNVCKQKHVTNMRNASASEDSLRLIAVHPLTLEECLEFIDDDELLEITPKNLRMRKRILGHEERARAAYRAKG
jgi:hypothetical protein